MELPPRRITELPTKDIDALLRGGVVKGLYIPADYPDAFTYFIDVLFASNHRERVTVGKNIISFINSSNKSTPEYTLRLLQAVSAAAFDTTDAPSAIALLRRVVLDQKYVGQPNHRADCHREALFGLSYHDANALRDERVNDCVERDLNHNEYCAAAFGLMAVANPVRALEVLPRTLKRMNDMGLPLNAILHAAAQAVRRSGADPMGTESRVRKGCGEKYASMFEKFIAASDMF